MGTAQAFNAMATAYSVATAAMFPDVVTFQRPTNTVSSVGGYTSSASATSPASVPCKWEPYTGKEFQAGEKIISEGSYVIKVPAVFSSSLIDVDGACQAVVAARTGGELVRTFSVDYIERFEGIEIRVYASLEC